MKISEFMDELEVMGAVSKWKELRKKYERYVSEIPVGEYEKGGPAKQMISVDEFQDVVNPVYDIFCRNAAAHEISKPLLLLFNEVKTFALNKDIRTYGDGFLEFRTSIAAALCDILTENIDYGDTRQLLCYLDDRCQTHEEGYYVLNVSDLTFFYAGKDVDLSKYTHSDESEG